MNTYNIIFRLTDGETGEQFIHSRFANAESIADAFQDVTRSIAEDTPCLFDDIGDEAEAIPEEALVDFEEQLRNNTIMVQILPLIPDTETIITEDWE